MQTKESFYLTEPLLPDGYERFYDTFAGGGGSGSGILKAYGRLGIQPNGTFVNHWDKAIEIHSANHPEHRHFKEDLFLMNPVEHMPKQRYGLGWSSPSCQQFSISRGNRPINEQGRSHADTVVEWMIHCLPEVQFVENVKEFLQWGRLRQRRCKKTEELLWAMEVPGKKKGTTKIRTFPTLDPEHRRRKNEPEAEWELRMIGLGYDRHMEPDPEFKGEYFLAWVKRIEALGYVSDYRLLRSADYGDPTIRQRLFVQFVRIDTGKRIVWPDQRFIKPGAKRPVFNKHQDRPLLPWPTARNSVIDWSHKGTSIFSGRKPLAKATMRRIAIGLVKFGLRDFFVPQSNFGGDRTRSTDEPVSTIQCNHRGEMLVDAFSLTSNKGFDAGIRGLDKPSATMTCNSRGEGIAEPWIIPNFGERPGQIPRTASVDQPTATVTSHGAGGLCEASFSWIQNKQGLNPHMNPPRSPDEPLNAVITDGRIHLCEAQPVMLQFARGSEKPGDCERRVSDGDKPLPSLTTTNSEAVTHPVPFMIPKDQGHLADYVTGVDQPCTTVQTTAVDHLAVPCVILLNGKSDALTIDAPLGAATGTGKQSVMEPCIIQMNGQSTAISTDSPLGAITGMQTQYVMTPHISHLRNGDGMSGVDEPLRTLTAAGQHQLLTEAFLMVMDNAGKGGDSQRAFSADEPIKTVVTKANHTMADPKVEEIMDTAVKFSLESLEDAVRKLAPAGVDPSRVIALLEPLMAELKKMGRADIRPWVYVYYSNGAVGSDIDAPVPTIRCKEATAVCYPVLEIDGNHMLLDVLYRMLSVKELQKAQGFPPDFIWPPGITKTDIVKAIGNSVSCGVAEALTLAWYSQDEDISGFFEEREAAA